MTIRNSSLELTRQFTTCSGTVVTVARMMLFILNTGCRQIESRYLKWQDVNFNSNNIIFRDTKSHKDVTIPMGAETRLILRKQWRDSFWTKEDDFVFTQPNGKIMCKLSHNARKKLTAAGIGKSFRPTHGLRHFYGTQLIASGVDLKTVSSLMGHNNLSTTERYLASRDARKLEAAKIVSELHTRLRKEGADGL